MSQTRRAHDVNCRFDETDVQPHGGPAMRFELEIACLIEEHGSDPIDAEMVVAWRFFVSEATHANEKAAHWRPVPRRRSRTDRRVMPRPSRHSSRVCAKP